MPTQIETRSLAGQLMPFRNPGDARQNAVAWAPDLTVKAGDVIAQRTTDNLTTLYVAAGANGTGVGRGVSMYDFFTDANGKVYFGENATPSRLNPPFSTAPIWEKGIFQVSDLKVGGAATTATALETAFGDLGHTHIDGTFEINA